MEFHANDEDTTTITKDGIILSIIQCQTAAEASQRVNVNEFLYH